MWRRREWQKRERQLPKAVEAGAAALIEAAARKIAERIDAVGVRPGGPAPRVRVAPAPHTSGRTAREEFEVERGVNQPGHQRERER